MNGETFLYMGQQYRLKIIRGGDVLDIKLRGYFEVTVPLTAPGEDKRDLVEGALWQWYLNHAEQKVSEVIREYVKKTPHRPAPSVQGEVPGEEMGKLPERRHPAHQRQDHNGTYESNRVSRSEA